MCLVDDNLYETGAEIFSEVLENYSKFLRKEDFTLLYSIFGSQWAQQRYERLVQGDYDFDSIQFGLFILAFGDATVGDLIKGAETDPRASNSFQHSVASWEQKGLQFMKIKSLYLH